MPSMACCSVRNRTCTPAGVAIFMRFCRTVFCATSLLATTIMLAPSVAFHWVATCPWIQAVVDARQ